MSNTRESKTIEFARLFDLFERLASRRSRVPEATATTTTTTVNDIPALPMSAEHSPVLRKLARLAGARERKNEHNISRNAMEQSVPVEDETDSPNDEEPLPIFPLEQRYTFTFKLMIHKLYGLEEWAKKIKDVVEKSRMQFKPLAEQQSHRRTSGTGDETVEGGVLFEIKALSEGRKEGMQHRRPARRSATKTVKEEKAESRTYVKARVTGRGNHRSYSVTDTADVFDGNLQIEQPKHETYLDLHDGNRILKKRCIGRRKSLSGPTLGKAEEGWVYEAVVSSVESASPRCVAPFQPHNKKGSAGEPSLFLQSGQIPSEASGALNETHGIETRIVIKRRALSFTDNDSEETRRARKRPLLQ